MHLFDPGLGSRLRVLRPDEPATWAGEDFDFLDRDTVSPATPLSAFFHLRVLPHYLVPSGAAANNIAQYRESLKLWVNATGDPPLAEIDDEVCRTFLAALAARKNREGEPVSPNTVIKHITSIQKMLRLAGPRTDGNRQGYSRKGLFGLDEDGFPRWTPYLQRPKSREALPSGGWTLEEIALWLDACEFHPRGTRWSVPLLPAVFFRALIILLYNTALRIDTALHVTRAMIHRTWLEVPAELMKGRRRPHAVYLNEHARQAIEALRTAHDDRIVPWPYSQNCLCVHIREQVATCTTPERRKQIPKPLHALRARCLTILWGRNAGVAKMVAGHVRGDVTLGFYVGRSAMRRELKRLPQPITKAAKGNDAPAGEPAGEIRDAESPPAPSGPNGSAARRGLA